MSQTAEPLVLAIVSMHITSCADFAVDSALPRIEDDKEIEIGRLAGDFLLSSEPTRVPDSGEIFRVRAPLHVRRDLPILDVCSAPTLRTCPKLEFAKGCPDSSPFWPLRTAHNGAIAARYVASSKAQVR